MEMKRAFKASDYERSLTILEASAQYGDEKNRLLYHLEKGAVLFQQKKHHQSALSFRQAKDILRELYTKRLSKKALALFTNEGGAIAYLLRKRR